MTSNLKVRFEEFIKGFPGFESIDQLLISGDPQGKKRADYLLWDRKIILEQKSLELDPSEKLQNFMDQVISENGILAYGSVSTQQIFKGLPDGDDLQKQLLSKITDRIDKIFASADKQTRDTREIFNIPGAGGVLLILNDTANTLSPEVIGHKVSYMCQKQDANGALRYPENQAVMLISETHHLASKYPTKLLPIVTILGPLWRDNLTIEYFSRELGKAWATYNNLPYIEGENSLLKNGFTKLK